MRRDTPEVETVLGNLAELHSNGAAIDWAREHPEGDIVALPTMVWQHRPYWIFPATSNDTGPGGGHDPAKHSLLGGRMTVSGAPARQVWQTHLDMSCRPYPQSHEVVNVEITPAASIINTFVLAAGRDGRIPSLADIVLRTPLAIEPPRVVQVVLSENTVRLASRIAHDETASEDEEHEWITHTTATVEPTRELDQGGIDEAAIRSRCPQVWDWDRVDGMFRTKGVGGYAFPWGLDELRRSDDEQLSILTLEPAPARHSSSWAHVVDGALTISAVLVTPEDAHRLWMSCYMDSVAFEGEPPARITVYTKRSARSPEDTVDVLVADEDGRIVCEVGGLRFAPLQDQAGTTVASPRNLVHEIVWRPLGQDGESPTGTVARVTLIGDDTVVGPLAEQLQQAGVECHQLSSAEGLRSVTGPQPDAVLLAPTGLQPGETPEQAAERCAWTLIRTAQRLAETQTALGNYTDPQPKLWCLTQGVRAAVQETALAHAPLWGVSRIVAGEHPELWGGLIDVAGFDAGTGARVLELLRRAPSEDVISITGDELTVARLSPMERTSDGGTAVQCRPGGTYLITGGLGALGLEVARWLVDRGASRLLLAGRTGLPARSDWDKVRDLRTRRQIDGVLALEALGVTVRVLALDITDADQVAAALDPSSHGMPPIRGIVHAAGVVRDAMLDKVDREGLRDVLAPKANGAMVLHRLFPPGTLDFFALFSSCGQFARLTGQTTYAAANSFLDTLAAFRQSGGHTDTTSLGWTAWRGVGMSESIGGTMLEANARGLEAVSAAEAFRAWSFADRFQAPYKAILRVLPTPPHSPRLPMFRELTAVTTDADNADNQGFAIDWALPEAELRAFVIADVREQVAAELNLAADDVEIRRPLIELGIDSVMSVALRVRLTRRYGLDLPPTILWNQPTVAALGGHLIESLRPDAEPVAEDATGAVDPTHRLGTELALQI